VSFKNLVPNSLLFSPKIAPSDSGFSSTQLDILDLYKIVQDPGLNVFGAPDPGSGMLGRRRRSLQFEPNIGSSKPMIMGIWMRSPVGCDFRGADQPSDHVHFTVLVIGSRTFFLYRQITVRAFHNM
jgi:hypothetical protein